MDYNEIKRKISDIETTIESLENQIEKGNRDKGGIYFYGCDNYGDPKIVMEGNFRYAHIRFKALHGYYGSSGCHDDMSPLLARYILKALDKLRINIINTAIEIARADIVELAKQAEKEAKKILELSRQNIHKEE